LFSKSPFSKTPFSKSSGSLWVLDKFQFILGENAFVDKINPGLILADGLNFVVSDIEPAHVAFAVVDSDLITLSITPVVPIRDIGVFDTLIDLQELINSIVFSSVDSLSVDNGEFDNVFVDKINPGLLLEDEVNFIVSDVIPAHTANAVTGNDLLSMFTTSIIISNINLFVSDIIIISISDLSILDKHFFDTDSLFIGINELPIFPNVSIDNTLIELIDIRITDEIQSTIFKTSDVVKIINANINKLFTISAKISNSFIISGRVDKLVQLRGDYKLPEINQDLEMWAGEAIDIEIQGVLPEVFDSIIWRVLIAPDSTEADDIIITKSWTLGESGGGIELPDNRIKISLQFEDTQELGGNRYFHEARVWNGSDPNTIATGRLKIIPSTFIDIEV